MRHLTIFLWLAAGVATIAVGADASALRKRQFVTLHQWTDIELTFPSEEDLQHALENGHYNRKHLVPVDVDVEYGDDGYHRTFLTIPRLNGGVPYSLAVVRNADNLRKLNPKLKPYPDYVWHSSHGLNCSGITSAIRSYIDDCWRLWIVDSGQINSMQYCDPQILAFDLITDQLVHRYRLPPQLHMSGVSVFTALIADVAVTEEAKHNCGRTMVYIADPWGYGLIVYDAQRGNAWRIEHELMQPDRDLQTANAASDGIFTVSLDSSEMPQTERRLYFHALNSYTEVAGNLNVVNNATLWLHASPTEFELASRRDSFRVIGTRGTQCESETMDSAGNLYCSLISSNALVQWERNADYNSDNLKVVAYSPEQLKFVTGLKINTNAVDEDELWALSNDPRLFVGGSVKSGDVKFQVVGCRTRNLLTNEPCTVLAVEQAQ